jgi:hypothetical protein
VLPGTENTGPDEPGGKTLQRRIVHLGPYVGRHLPPELRSAANLLRGRWADAVYADRAYDSNNVRGKIAAKSSVGTNLGSDNDAASN